ncbi:hypothetical protein B0H19DRAFT_1062215 [Mycena capillaripes]|nr:hypothetical protein B0H19DRAFT_1062215 [Mycena capillaripes]
MANQSTLRSTADIDSDAADIQPHRQPSTTRHTANKENKYVLPVGPRQNDSRPAPKKSAPRRIESDDDKAYHPGNVDRDEGDEDNDNDQDDRIPVRGRTRHVSEKQAQRDEERAKAEAHKQDRLVKAAKAAKKKAGVVEPDTHGPINDNIFTSRTVPSTHPTATKNLAQHNSRVPPAPVFAHKERRASTSTAHCCDRDDEDDSHRAPSPHQPRHAFRGHSPEPKHAPVREPARPSCSPPHCLPPSLALPATLAASPLLAITRWRRKMLLILIERLERLASGPIATHHRHQQPSRVRAKDLDDITKEYAVLVMGVFRCYLSTEQAFPDSATESAMVRHAWKEACDEMGEWTVLMLAVAKLIASRGSQLRGELKTKICPFIDTMYGFKSGQNRKTIAFNHKLAEDLKEGFPFAFKDVENKKGLYKHPIFQSTINAMWFTNRRDEGPQHPELFSPLPIRALGVVLAAVENNIDECLTGVWTDVAFTANDYRAVYEGHLTENYQLMNKILKRLHNVGRFHSGAQALSTPATSTFSKQFLNAALKEYEEGETTDDASEAEE